MSAPVHGIRPDDDAMHARREMLRRDVFHLPVLDEGDQLVGIVDGHSIMAPRIFDRVPDRRGGLSGTPVRNIMRSIPRTLRPTAPGSEAAHLLMDPAITAVPITREDGELVGITTTRDVLDGTANEVTGLVQVHHLAGGELAHVHRHTSLPSILSTLREAELQAVAVTEGGDPLPMDARGLLQAPGAHAPAARMARDHGIVGLIDQRTLLASAWLDRNKPGVEAGKRIKSGRKAETGGPRRLRSVLVVETVAENIMRPVPAILTPWDDITSAAAAFVDTGMLGLPVLDEDSGQASLLQRSDVLNAIGQRLLRA